MKVVYDLETLAGVFTYTAVDVSTKKQYQYVIHPKRFELRELVDHLNDCTGMIGFNNISFDYPIIHHILISYESWLWNGMEVQDMIDEIYDKAQHIIQEQNNSKFGGGFGIKPKDIKIKQLDLFRIYHYNNAARATSLTSLEIAMNYPNVLDMEIDHATKKITKTMLHNILYYNLNDVLATLEFFNRSADKIKLRQDLTSTYRLNCMNYPDSKIGESLMLKLYCDATNKDPREVRKLRTVRNSIALKDCIFDYIRFKTPEFNNLLDTLKSKVITETKGSIKESVIFKGFKYDYGTGGIHGCIKAGVYDSDDEWIIIDADVGLIHRFN